MEDILITLCWLQTRRKLTSGRRTLIICNVVCATPAHINFMRDHRIVPRFNVFVVLIQKLSGSISRKGGFKPLPCSNGNLSHLLVFDVSHESMSRRLPSVLCFALGFSFSALFVGKVQGQVVVLDLTPDCP